MTTLVRWEPFCELVSLQPEMGRLVDGLLHGSGRTTTKSNAAPSSA